MAKAARGGHLLVVDPCPGYGLFIGKDEFSVLFTEPGMQRRDRWVIQDVGGLDRV